MTYEALKARVAGTVITAFEPGHAEVCDALIWNGRKPGRRARVIVRAAAAKDVQEAVRYAAENGLSVSPRGGGHQFSGIASQADMVIDLGALDGLRIDIAQRTARVEPAVSNSRLAAALERHGLAFPTGHCGSVTLSGYLLGGGVGWNAAEWGIACFSVLAVEVVLADGSLVTASAEQHPDIFWAARGAGPAFFGIVTAYHLKLQEAPAAATTVVRIYPGRAVKQVADWAEKVMAEAPSCVEFTVKIAPGPGEPVLEAIATIFARTELQSREICAMLAAEAPAGALNVIGPMPTPIPVLYEFTEPSTPAGARYCVDSVWSNARLEELLVPLVASFEGASSSKNFAVIVLRPNAGPVPGGAAFSCSGRIFAAVYALWEDAAADGANQLWLRGAIAQLRPYLSGSYIGEADLESPANSLPTVSPDVSVRLSTLAEHYDPQGLFAGRGRVGQLAAE